MIVTDGGGGCDDDSDRWLDIHSYPTYAVFYFKLVFPALVNNAQVRYIFPTALRLILRFFLKSTKANQFVMSPKNHSTVTQTLLIAVLKSCCCEVTGVGKGANRCMLVEVR